MSSVLAYWADAPNACLRSLVTWARSNLPRNDSLSVLPFDSASPSSPRPLQPSSSLLFGGARPSWNWAAALNGVASSASSDKAAAGDVFIRRILSPTVSRLAGRGMIGPGKTGEQAMLTATVLAYFAVLLAIGAWAQRRTTDAADFHLGGRRLGPVVAALSASASSSSAWTLLGVSGAAWAWGLQAIWLVPAVMLGFFINWAFIAPRLHAASHGNGALTLVQFLAEGLGARDQARLR